MKTDHLEKFIRDHRDEFDMWEPSPEVWKAIEKQVPPGRKIFLRPFMLRAAILLAVAAISGALLVTFLSPFPVRQARLPVDPALQELLEAEAFYAQQVNGKMKKIQACYQLFPQLKTEVESDLSELEMMYRQLQNDLQENISNKTVIEAMIENNRNRLKLVDEVLEQINC